MKIIRTALPVGQGAFYSERFLSDNGNGPIVVYDCGSFNKIPLSREINRLDEKDKEISLLFISHFDADHVNGVMELCSRYDVKKIVMPLITDNMWYLYALDAVYDNHVMSNFANFIRQSSDKIVEVNPFNDNRRSDNYYDISELTNHKVNSGINIGYDKIGGIYSWVYIPINISISNSLLDNLKIKILSINDNGLETKETDLENPSFIGKHTSEIKKIFESEKINVNESSLIVYSGPSVSEDVPWWRKPLYLVTPVYKLHPYLRLWYQRCNRLPACLFTGDSKLDSGRLNNILSCIGSLYENIGTLQVPHHGSVNNFKTQDYINSKFSSLDHLICFASFGKNSRFHHPSSRVVGDLVALDYNFIGVTEDRDSQLFEIIEKNNQCGNHGDSHSNGSKDKL